MIAGTETTATALAGVTYYLLQSPSCLARLTSEIRSEFSSMDDITFEQLARLPYLHAVLQEGLRLYPPVPVTLPRITPQGGIAIAGEWVPGGVTVGVHQVATYRSEANFTSPDEFHPERWLGDKAFANDALDSVEPFSVGPRNCLGKVRKRSGVDPSQAG
jgi:cytochrome P450